MTISPAAPTSSTARALIAACLAEPDEDGPRLAFADWLDEQPGRTCDVCVTGIIRREDAENIYDAPQCRHCHGTFADDFHARWAELIRVQCERERAGLKPIDPNTTANHPTHKCNICGGLWTEWPSDQGWSVSSREFGKCCDNVAMGEQIVRLTSKETKLLDTELGLLPTLRARLMPRCPGYHGDGHGWEDCPLCGKHPNPAYGICPGDLLRGFPRLTIPASFAGSEWAQKVVEEYGATLVFDKIASGESAVTPSPL